MKKIIVLGGGFAGAYAAQHLQDDFDVTLVDTKDYFEFTPSVLRVLVEPEHSTTIEALHEFYLPKCKLIQGAVTAVKKNEIIVDGEKKIYFDDLIICTGSRYNSHIKEENLIRSRRIQDLKKYAQEVKKAKSILIVGGGVVGTELAAEIVTTFSDKKIILIDAHTELLSRSPLKVQQYAHEFMEKHSVTMILGEKIVAGEQKNFKTNTGREIEVEMAFLCTGITPNSEFLENSFPKWLNERKYILINDYLQVKGQETIFSAGDVNAIQEEKTAQSAERQARIVVKNIFNLERGKKLVKYKHFEKPMVISLGKNDGIFVYKRFVLTGVIPGILKRIIEWKTMRQYR